MKLTMKVDEKQLERSLVKARKAFGESTEQATYRWGVQIARQLAGSTQAFGRGKKAQDVQINAIYADAFRVLRLVENRPQIKTPQECYEWIERHRTRSRRRTVILPEQQRATVTRDILMQALAPKIERVGMAKGAWIGGGIELSNRQAGMQKIRIGKGFLGYAQKFADKGEVIKRISLFKPNISLKNNVPHSSDQEVLSDSQKRNTVKRALINVIKWYDKAATAKLK